MANATAAAGSFPGVEDARPEEYDVVILGDGTGATLAAWTFAGEGQRVVVLDRKYIGGSCPNIACLPSKNVIHSAKVASYVRRSAEFGIAHDAFAINMSCVRDRKRKMVTGLNEMYLDNYKHTGAELIFGTGHFVAPKTVEVTLQDGSTRQLRGTNVIISTGTHATIEPIPGLVEAQPLTHIEALELDKVPEHLLVIGGGYIGLELGSVWQRLGAKVTVVEVLDHVVPNMDRELGTALQRVLARSGIEFKLGTKVAGVRQGPDELTVELEGAAGQSLTADVVLVAIGRRPYTEGLGLDAVGVALDEHGRVVVDDGFATNIPGIYGIGDVIRGPMLEHKAAEEGVALAERLAGQKTSVDYDAIPAVIYTWPEVASVGRTEEELKAAAISYRIGKFPFTANPRARTNGYTEGFVKILAESDTDRVLGVHIIGPDAGTLVAEATLAKEFGASAEDIARTCHAHPTLSEALKEAALAVDGRAIHI